MSVTINDTGVAAASILDQWLDLHPELPRGAGHELAVVPAKVDVHGNSHQLLRPMRGYGRQICLTRALSADRPFT